MVYDLLSAWSRHCHLVAPHWAKCLAQRKLYNIKLRTHMYGHQELKKDKEIKNIIQKKWKQLNSLYAHTRLLRV